MSKKEQEIRRHPYSFVSPQFSVLITLCVLGLSVYAQEKRQRAAKSSSL